MAAEGLTAPSGAVALHTVRCAGSAVSGATGAAPPAPGRAPRFFRKTARAAPPKPPPGVGGARR
ncbi:hypothetical protein FCZ12_24360, partial [Escherichia coli]|nr:hypothetical protein [Escherichia coli]